MSTDINRPQRVANFAGADLKQIQPHKTIRGCFCPYYVRQVANTGKATKDTSLSTLQRSTLQWMAWRESEDTGGGQRREGTEAAARLESSLNGGMLGHLSSEEASACVLALIQQEAANAPGGKNDRWASHNVTQFVESLWMRLLQNAWRCRWSCYACEVDRKLKCLVRQREVKDGHGRWRLYVPSLASFSNSYVCDLLGGVARFQVVVDVTPCFVFQLLRCSGDDDDT